MLIAVDATAVRSHNHGVGTYTANLLRSLLQVEPVNRYHVYLTRSAVSNTDLHQLLSERFRIETVTDSRPMRLLWEHFFMHEHARQLGADVLWGCHNSLPIRGKGPRVVTVHDLGVYAMPQFYPRSKVAYFRFAISHAVADADLVLADSRFTANELSHRLHVPHQRIRIVPGGVSPHFHPVTEPGRLTSVRTRYHLPGRYALTVGVPEPKKNLLAVVAAYKELRARGVRLPTLVIGGGRSYGWKNSETFRAIGELGDQVLTTDFIAFDDLPAVYSLAEFFIFASLYEGFGLPPLEAMACGTPVIVSNVASMPEVTGGAGVMVDPTRVSDIASAIRTLASDADLRTDLRCRGLIQASRWRWDTAAKDLVGAFSEVTT